MSSTKKRKIGIFCLFTIPAMALFIYFVMIPFLQTFYYSLTDWNGVGKNYHFIGFSNFSALLKDKTFWSSLWHNLQFCLVGGVFIFAISIFNAVFLTQSKLPKWERQVYRIIYFIPNILSIVIIASIWMFIYNPSYGILNSILRLFGVSGNTAWLGSKRTVIYALIAVWIWCSFGYYMVLYISAIERVPAELFESAEIDGANSWQRFLHITLPLIRETTKTCLIFFFINAFSGVFTIVNVMTDGGPSGASEVMTNYMYRRAFLYNDFGQSTAIGVTVFLILVIVSGATLLLTRSKEPLEY